MSYLDFFNLVPKEYLAPKGPIFNKVNRGIVQKPDEVVTQNWPAGWLLLRQVFGKI